METDVNREEQNLSRREREKLFHRKEIMDAALGVFSRKGFFNATLEEIAQEAEFSKGTLYLYFTNKEDLLFSILTEKIQIFLRVINETLTGKSSFRDELHDLFVEFARLAFREKDFFTVIMTQHAGGFTALSPEKAAEFGAVHEEFDRRTIHRIEQAIEDGELREIKPELVYRLIHGAIENMMITHWCCKTQKELFKSVDIFLDLLFNGIAKKKEISR